MASEAREYTGSGSSAVQLGLMPQDLTTLFTAPLVVNDGSRSTTKGGLAGDVMVDEFKRVPTEATQYKRNWTAADWKRLNGQNDSKKGDTMFETYRKAHDEMQSDCDIVDCRLAIVELDNKLANAMESLSIHEAPYRERMEAAAAEIKEAILSQRQTVLLFGVEAKYKAGRRSPKWKSIAMFFEPPDDIIEMHTTPAKPSVSIRVVE